MLCECGQREATVHEVVIKQGKKAERHLCEQCAREAGLGAPAPTQVSELLGKLMAAQASKPKPPKAAQVAQAGARCPTCGAAFAEFKALGLLGCPDCYKAFEALLGPLLERAQDGGLHHVGKVPRAALERSRKGGEADESAILGSAVERAKRVESLRRALEEAVAGEQYEKAARLRDELRQMGDPRV